MSDLLPFARASGLVARLVAFAFASSLVACGLLYGFDRYDTDVTAGLDGAVAEAGTPADFELVVADTLRIEPGTSAPLVVSVVRRSGASERIVVLVSDPLPAGVERGVAATIEPDASSAILIITVRSDAPAITQTLHLQAASASGARTKDVALTSRGLPCAPDRGFGPTADGVVHLPFSGTGTVRALGLAASGDTITFVLQNAGIVDVYRLDATGTTRWTAGLPTDTAGFSVDSASGVVIVRPDALTRLAADGGPDPAFGPAGNGVVVPFCGPVATVTMGVSGTTIICASAPVAAFTPSRFDLAGAETQGETIDFGATVRAKLAASRESHGGGFIACGNVTDGESHTAFMRWLPSGKHDETFGTAGHVVLDGGGGARSCVADDLGTVAIDVAGADSTLLALDPIGALDHGFGDGGAVPLRVDGNTEVLSSDLALDMGNVLAAASQGVAGRVFVLRYLRDGRLDTSFGQGGQCALGALGLADVASVLVTNDHKLLVLTTGVTDAFLARIWL